MSTNETPARESVDVERLARELCETCYEIGMFDMLKRGGFNGYANWTRVAEKAIELLAPPRDSSPAASGEGNVRVEEIPGGLAIKTTRSPVQWSKEPRCEVCDWPLAPSTGSGCRPGDCRYRPTQGSDEWYRINARRAEIAAREASPAPSGTGTTELREVGGPTEAQVSEAYEAKFAHDREVRARAKSCPFDGTPPDVEECEDDSVYVRCTLKACPLHQGSFDLESWNRRAPVTPPAPEGEGMSHHGRVVALAELLTEIEALDGHGCVTGDCPHQKNDQCADALRDYLKELAADAKKLADLGPQPAPDSGEVERQIRVRFSFHDWMREGESIYTTKDGIALALGDFHLGTIFDGTLTLGPEQLRELHAALKVDATPTFLLFEAALRPRAPERDAGQPYPGKLCECGYAACWHIGGEDAAHYHHHVAGQRTAKFRCAKTCIEVNNPSTPPSDRDAALERDSVLEEAAKVCDEQATGNERAARQLTGMEMHACNFYAAAQRESASRIRALKSRSEAKGSGE